MAFMFEFQGKNDRIQYSNITEIFIKATSGLYFYFTPNGFGIDAAFTNAGGVKCL